MRSGSEIYTDLWKGYSWLDNRPYYNHATVNHSKCFKDEQIGVHTNTVEGTNSGLKRVIPIRGRVKGGIEGRLGEFVWRKKNGGQNIWEALVEAMREIEYN